MEDAQCKLIILEIDRTILFGGDPEREKFVQTMLSLKAQGSGAFLVVPESESSGLVVVLGYLKGQQMHTKRDILVMSILVDMRTNGINIEGSDVIYISDNESGRKEAEQWCRFENVGPGCSKLNPLLDEISRANKAAKALETPVTKQSLPEPSLHKPEFHKPPEKHLSRKHKRILAGR